MSGPVTAPRKHRRSGFGPALLVLLSTVLSGCTLLPEIAHQPTLHNPFPQLSTVAIVPFINLSEEPTLDGRRFAEAYFNELQLLPGFEVIPVGVVEQAILRHRIQFTPDKAAGEARRLAQVLGADAVVVGAVTDYSPYYPPRCSLQVEWYASNPCFHPIPPGYGLPWGTPDEEHIPAPLVYETEFALAKAQMATQTPDGGYTILNAAGSPGPQAGAAQQKASADPAGPFDPAGSSVPKAEDAPAKTESGLWIEETSHQQPIATATGLPASTSPGAPAEAAGGAEFGFPPDWPDPSGLVPSPPRVAPQSCCPSDQPVLRHTQAYNGHDPEFTEALSSYYFFRDDARFGGWQTYLERSDDFIRFCCHMHIWEMLSARGGAGETRVVWRWPEFR
ncbi:MAG: hypothetical protein ACYC6Y_00545 [Thermoguttaceae bacterium]